MRVSMVTYVAPPVLRGSLVVFFLVIRLYPKSMIHLFMRTLENA